VVGTDRAVSYADVARVHPMRPAQRFGGCPAGREYLSNGTHVCEIEIDPETGQTQIVNYTIVDDSRHGEPDAARRPDPWRRGAGVGQALTEHTVYDADGQLITATFIDYAMPRAWDFPSIHFETRNVPSTWKPARHQGRGRGWHHRRRTCRDECGRRRAAPRLRHPPYRYARHPAADLEAIQAARA
jgi:carbon-monoxide dehydrogenase large subunit